MEEKSLTEIPPGQGDSRSSKEFISALMEKADLFDPGSPIALKSALWLDYFLNEGALAFKEKWGLLPPEEKNLLGMEILKCYLRQPLFLRLSREGKGGIAGTSLVSEKKGKLWQVTFASGKKKILRMYYPLPHHRLWPDLLEILAKDFFPSSSTSHSLERELALASGSRLAHLRQRTETLRIFFPETASQEPPPQPLEKEMAESDLNQGSAAFAPLSQMETDLPPPASVIPKDKDKRSGPGKKKKRKSADDQMKLF
jgi:hypothetical protein